MSASRVARLLQAQTVPSTLAFVCESNDSCELSSTDRALARELNYLELVESKQPVLMIAINTCVTPLLLQPL